MRPSMCIERRQCLILQIYPAEPTLGCRDMCLPEGIGTDAWEVLVTKRDRLRHFPCSLIYQLEYQQEFQNFHSFSGKVHLPLGKFSKAETSPTFPRKWVLILVGGKSNQRKMRPWPGTDPDILTLSPQLAWSRGTQLSAMCLGQVSLLFWAQFPHTYVE